MAETMINARVKYYGVHNSAETAVSNAMQCLAENADGQENMATGSPRNVLNP